MQDGGVPMVRWKRPAAMRRALDARRYHGYGWREYAGEAAAAVAMKVGGGAVKRRFSPSLPELVAAASGVAISPAEFLRSVHGLDAPAMVRLQTEYTALRGQLEQRYRSRPLSHPPLWGIGEGGAEILYYLVRLTRPRCMLETGVANGHSTFFILNAMRLNGEGRLTSIDVSPAVGVLLDVGERDRWRLVVLDPQAPEAGFEAALTAAGPLDAFIHDSDHAYRWQLFEYRRAWQALRPGGLLISHDVDCSYAFLDFCHGVGRRPAVVVDRFKATGVIFGR